MSILADNETLTLACRALGRIARYGRRGTTLITLDEIEAMAALLEAYGVPVLAPDQAVGDAARPTPSNELPNDPSKEPST